MLEIPVLTQYKLLFFFTLTEAKAEVIFQAKTQTKTFSIESPPRMLHGCSAFDLAARFHVDSLSLFIELFKNKASVLQDLIEEKKSKGHPMEFSALHLAACNHSSTDGIRHVCTMTIIQRTSVGLPEVAWSRKQYDYLWQHGSSLYRVTHQVVPEFLIQGLYGCYIGLNQEFGNNLMCHPVQIVGQSLLATPVR